MMMLNSTNRGWTHQAVVPSKEMSREIWPSFFIVGAPRAGTTSLYENLRCVPGIYMSPVKEPNFFSAGLYRLYRGKPILAFGRRFPRNQDRYLKLFEDVKDELAVGEASVSYLSDPEAPGRIKAVVPGARIIMILRDPVERAYSQYLLHVRAGWQRKPFGDEAQTDLYLEPSLYAQAVQRYLDVFGSDHIKILIYEEFIQDVRKAVGEVLKFLGVNAEPSAITGKAFNDFAPPDRSLIGRFLRSRPVRITKRLLPPWIRSMMRHQVPSGKASRPPMPEKARRSLEEVCRADVLTLEHILGRSLPWFHARGRLV